MSKLDLTKLHEECYTSHPDPHVIEVPPWSFLTIAGRGAPGGKAYQEKLEPLYALAYRVKFLAKDTGNDYVVCKLEGLWWFDDPELPIAPPREQWNWKMMIRQPDFVAAEMIQEARRQVEAKKKLPAVHDVSFERYDEGLAAQIMHLGSYAGEDATIARLHAFIRERGRQPHGLHHEIYLSDPNKVAPEKLRTIIRQPIH